MNQGMPLLFQASSGVINHKLLGSRSHQTSPGHRLLGLGQGPVATHEHHKPPRLCCLLDRKAVCQRTGGCLKWLSCLGANWLLLRKSGEKDDEKDQEEDICMYCLKGEKEQRPRQALIPRGKTLFARHAWFSEFTGHRRVSYWVTPTCHPLLSTLGECR